MDLETLRLYCLSKPGTTESFPFDKDTLVFKVMNKMFAIIPLERFPFQINLKCDPELALEYRDEYPDRILPGYHMSKVHWNTVIVESDLSSQFVKKMVDDSYDLIVAKMTKKLRAELDALS